MIVLVQVTLKRHEQHKRLSRNSGHREFKPLILSNSLDLSACWWVESVLKKKRIEKKKKGNVKPWLTRHTGRQAWGDGADQEAGTGARGRSARARRAEPRPLPSGRPVSKPVPIRALGRLCSLEAAEPRREEATAHTNSMSHLKLSLLGEFLCQIIINLKVSTC